jgi:MoxR-like ATPase
MKNAREVATFVHEQCAKVIVGQEEVLRQLLLVLFVGGHGLLEGVPGLAKTLATKTLAHVFDLKFQRVQCTPDLMPADVLGANVFNAASGAFSLHKGPIFTDLLLVDEINRTPPRTQSALLEAMQERQVTIDGHCHTLSHFFSVFATQNPIEFEGTYPLPEAQLDRFLVKVRVGYPDAEQEIKVLQNFHGGFEPYQLENAKLEKVQPETLDAARLEISRVRVEPALFRYTVALVTRTRTWPAVSLGGSPRASVCMMLAAKAMAAMEGRDFLIPDDVKAVAHPVLRHRLILKPEADLEGITADQVIREVIHAVEVPK